MKTPIITLLALLFTSLVNAQNCNLTTHKKGSDTTAVYYESADRLFVASGPAKTKSYFNFSTYVRDFITLTIFVESGSKPKTYNKFTIFNLQLEDNSIISLSIGDAVSEPKFYPPIGASGNLISLLITKEEAEKILKIKPLMLMLGESRFDGGFYLQPDAKKYFLEDLRCIVDKMNSK